VEKLQISRDVEAVRRRLADAPPRIEHQDDTIESRSVAALIKIEKRPTMAKVASLFAAAARPKTQDPDD
jgi:hypothetical protein